MKTFTERYEETKAWAEETPEHCCIVGHHPFAEGSYVYDVYPDLDNLEDVDDTEDGLWTDDEYQKYYAIDFPMVCEEHMNQLPEGFWPNADTDEGSIFLNGELHNSTDDLSSEDMSPELRERLGF